jgi:hypothetical protein
MIKAARLFEQKATTLNALSQKVVPEKIASVLE